MNRGRGGKERGEARKWRSERERSRERHLQVIPQVSAHTHGRASFQFCSPGLWSSSGMFTVLCHKPTIRKWKAKAAERREVRMTLGLF